jgi:hypothetical protein
MLLLHHVKANAKFPATVLEFPTLLYSALFLLKAFFLLSIYFRFLFRRLSATQHRSKLRTMAPGGGSSSRNISLALIIALSAYVPFEIVAKATVILGIILFVWDPIPPYSRLIAIISCLVVLKLNTWHRNSIIEQQHLQEQELIEITTNYNTETEKNQNNNEDDVDVDADKKKDQ